MALLYNRQTGRSFLNGLQISCGEACPSCHEKHWLLMFTVCSHFSVSEVTVPFYCKGFDSKCSIRSDLWRDIHFTKIYQIFCIKADSFGIPEMIPEVIQILVAIVCLC